MIEAIITPPPFYGYSMNENGVVLNPRKVVDYKDKGLSVSIEIAQIYPGIWCGDVHITRSGGGRYYGCGGPVTRHDKQDNLRETINRLLWYVHSYLERNEDKQLAGKFLESLIDCY